ncbi:MAG: MBL fold metallo-hydrolase [Phormidesmis sp.]
MDNFICVTCGTQFAQTAEVPEHCPICTDERQYVGYDGQQWTTLLDLKKDRRNRIEQQENNLYGIGTEPKFAIGQRALLVCSAQGNVLWDCISLIDDATIGRVKALGGLSAIAISHPHYYASAVEWAHAFDVKVYLHAADRMWMMRPDSSIEFWEGETLTLSEDLTLIKAGGHFDGGTVCHWRSGAAEAGVLLTGDVIQVVADKCWVSFMYSYPNYIPLSAAKVGDIESAVEPYAFDRLYGAWWPAIVVSNAKERVNLSAARYIKALQC